MAAESPGRKPTPVQVVYFPKSRPRPQPAPRTTQSIPEVKLSQVEEPVTEVEVEVVPKKGAERKKRRTQSSPGIGRVTLSDERHASEGGHGLSDLAVLGHELFSRGRVSESKAIFEGLVVSSPEDAFARTMLGTICLSLGDFDRALGLFEQALELDPCDVPALVYRGELRLERKKIKAAVGDFERATELGDPGDPFVERAQRLLKLARKGERR